MDIIVTTPKSEIINAYKEAEDAKAGLVDYYFRKLGNYPSFLETGDRVFYVEDGYITGFAVCSAIANQNGNKCNTTNKNYSNGVFVWMRCDSWKWIKPIPLKGFQGFRYRIPTNTIVLGARQSKPIAFDFEIVGDWKDNKPKIN